MAVNAATSDRGIKDFITFMVSQWLTGRPESPNGAGRGFHPQPNLALQNIPPHLCAGAQFGHNPAWSLKPQPDRSANLLIGGNGAARRVRRRCFACGARRLFKQSDTPFWPGGLCILVKPRGLFWPGGGAAPKLCHGRRAAAVEKAVCKRHGRHPNHFRSHPRRYFTTASVREWTWSFS